MLCRWYHDTNRWHKRKTKEKAQTLINASPPLPKGASSIHCPSITHQSTGAGGMWHVTKSTHKVSWSQTLLTTTSVLSPLPQRCWVSHCVNCALWQAGETDAATIYFFYFLATVNSSLLPWVIGLMSGNNRSLAPSHMISFFVLAACKNLSWSLES